MKQINIRLSDESGARFKSYCEEEGLSHPQAIDALLAIMELSKSKEALPGRRTDIESFEMHIKALLDAFIHSLEINAEAEERSKLEFISSLESKDRTIIDLQKKIESLEATLTAAENAQQDSEHRATKAEKEAAAAITAAENARCNVMDKEAMVKMLTDNLAEAECKLNDYDKLKVEVQAAKTEIEQLKQQLKDAEYAEKNAKIEAQLQFAKEREQLERDHRAEIIALYDKLFTTQEQTLSPTAPQPETATVLDCPESTLAGD